MKTINDADLQKATPTLASPKSHEAGDTCACMQGAEAISTQPHTCVFCGGPHPCSPEWAPAETRAWLTRMLDRG